MHRGMTTPLLFSKMRRRWWAGLVALCLPLGAWAFEPFQQARPIWPAGREREKNLSVGFRTSFEVSDQARVIVRLTGRTLYRLFLNGRFVGHGPARGPHGYDRVDEWDATPQARPGLNVLAIEVAGYNVNSYYLLDQPAYLQAEVLVNGRVVRATGRAGAGFEAHLIKERVQKVQRYSFQRPFIEVYRLRPGYDAWRREARTRVSPVDCQVQPSARHLPRRVAYPRFEKRSPVRLVARGALQKGALPKHVWKDR